MIKNLLVNTFKKFIIDLQILNWGFQDQTENMFKYLRAPVEICSIVICETVSIS